MFTDRRHAGQQLAQALAQYKNAPNSIVLALPRGGVAVGYEISLALRLPLDVFVTRKLGTPDNPELAMGALAETGYRHLNMDVIRGYGISTHELEREVDRQRKEIARRVERYRGGTPLPDLSGKTVILVDDGVATGATFFASVAAMRALQVGRLVAALPVAPPETARILQARVDEAVVLATPSMFFGISQFYEDFPQLEDDEVIACLQNARAALRQG
jgi:putative phosphoribosyl transferase